MSFSCTPVRWQLMNKGLVATFRTKKRKKLGNDWANDGRCRPKICDIHVSLEKEIKCSIYDFSLYRVLAPYVKDSGFISLDFWLAEILKLNPKIHSAEEIKGFLYIVTKREGMK